MKTMALGFHDGFIWGNNFLMWKFVLLRPAVINRSDYIAKPWNYSKKMQKNGDVSCCLENAYAVKKTFFLFIFSWNFLLDLILLEDTHMSFPSNILCAG